MSNWDTEIKSLKKQVETAPDGVVKIKALLEMALYSSDHNEKQALDYTERAYRMALKLNDSEEEKAKLIAGCQRYLGTFYTFIPDYSKALEYNKLALEYYEKLNDEVRIGELLTSIASVYLFIQDFAKAIAHYEKALKIFREHDKQPQTLKTLNNIVAMYDKASKKDIALDYALEAIELALQLGEEKTLASLYGNLGQIYQYTDRKQQAIETYHKSLEIRKKLNHTIGYGKIHQNLGTLYMEMGNYEKALESLKIALEVAEKSGSQYSTMTAKQVIGITYTKMGRYKMAEKILEEALQSAIAMKADRIGSIQEDLSNLYEKMGEYKKAYAYSKKYIEYVDSRYKSELNEKLADMKVRYDLDKKEQKAKFAKLESEILKSKNEQLQKINKKLKKANITIKKKNENITINHKELEELNNQLHNIANNRSSILTSIIDEINAIILFRNPNGDFITNSLAKDIIDELLYDIPRDMRIKKLFEFLTDDKDSKFIKINNYYGTQYKSVLTKKPIIVDCTQTKVQSFNGDFIGDLVYCRNLSDLVETQEKLENFQNDIQKDSEILRRKNIALKEVLDHIENEKNQQKEIIQKKIDMIIMPLIPRIQSSGASNNELLQVLEKNLRSLVYANSKLHETYKTLSQREIEICNMIKNGLSSKEIASNLNIEPSTVNRHRNRIRKKLGICGKKINLPNYLKNNT